MTHVCVDKQDEHIVGFGLFIDRNIRQNIN